MCVSMCVLILKVQALVFLIELYSDRYSESTNEDKTYLTSSFHQPTHEQDQNHFRQTKICSETEVSLTVTSFVQSFGFRTSARQNMRFLATPICAILCKKDWP